MYWLGAFLFLIQSKQAEGGEWNTTDMFGGGGADYYPR
jgi:hypothetical protein